MLCVNFKCHFSRLTILITYGVCSGEMYLIWWVFKLKFFCEFSVKYILFCELYTIISILIWWNTSETLVGHKRQKNKKKTTKKILIFQRQKIDCAVTDWKITTDNSILPWCTVATTDHPGKLRNVASQEYPRTRKHQVAITAHDHWWSHWRTCEGTRKQTYSWYILANTHLPLNRRGHRMAPPKQMYAACACYYKQIQETLAHTGLLHDKLGQDPLHGWEESKVRLEEKKKREKRHWSDTSNT